ncbi:hypothetical protein Tco_0414305 [Tanacetum coccineum]
MSSATFAMQMWSMVDELEADEHIIYVFGHFKVYSSLVSGRTDMTSKVVWNMVCDLSVTIRVKCERSGGLVYISVFVRGITHSGYWVLSRVRLSKKVMERDIREYLLDVDSVGFGDSDLLHLWGVGMVGGVNGITLMCSRVSGSADAVTATYWRETFTERGVTSGVGLDEGERSGESSGCSIAWVGALQTLGWYDAVVSTVCRVGQGRE